MTFSEQITNEQEGPPDNSSISSQAAGRTETAEDCELTTPNDHSNKSGMRFYFELPQHELPTPSSLRR